MTEKDRVSTWWIYVLAPLFWLLDYGLPGYEECDDE